MIFTKLIRQFGILTFGASLCAPLALQAQDNTGTTGQDSTLNTRYNEIKPIVSPDGQTLYFSRSNHALNAGGRRDKGDVWKARLLADGETGLVQPAAQVFNSPEMNMVIGFTANGRDIYYQTYNPETKTKRQSGIYKVSANGGRPQQLTIHYFFNGAKYQDATISPDGKVMLLSLESYSTYGLEDLYVSFQQPDGSWSEPKNLGPDINTPRQEMSAWLSTDGRTIYFTSNGHGGEGSMDIFRSVRQDGSWKRWSTPENLGPEVNTAGAEMYYSEDPKGEWAWFSSTQNSEGYGDIRKIRIPQRAEEQPLVEEIPSDSVAQDVIPPPAEVAAIEEQVSDTIEDVTVIVRQAFDLQAKILNEQGNVQQANIRISQPDGSFQEEAVTDGMYFASLPEAGEYSLRVQARGYFPLDTTVQVTEGTSRLNLNLRPIRVGETVRLQNVMFRQSTAVLLEESNEALDEVVELMKENPQMEILLTGHTDNQGNSRANIRLSRERVEAVKNYLISRGIEENRIEGKGYGGTRPIASNANEETRKLNRRVEFTITRK